ncbi:phenylacetate-CoA oxygenase subunit PaaJ [Herbaspirillum seropedicae]|uniref:Phenylacetic acid degradation protein n=1 Tax=Herbaspirillum seropedicae (strain SmR1) TaxID=757424 RepID=D8ITG8_HERSS|nr:1,2-phenylacetyl-CoA epoxidase subunit PaaD [Herbaspirillum seropedicae]ADJ65598.1 phenylacetic acid degradation protein [Herbaspirillum seropedicae SmR1]AKN68357.1 phenylacetate-CoA oxygenase [Herbaspirillum seropedicae]UMU23426.1 phenylacetate-CoA oxygenase subunit PaaJ [Herbaspirillum seropedicae]
MSEAQLALQAGPDALKARIWDWLEAVPDPEIPVLSVVDLGIVREVEIEAAGAVDARCTVVITPTYSGCPAMGVIAEDITTVLQEKGLAQVAIRIQLAPAWSTDWMSEKGRHNLRQYGIAPPAQQVIDIRGIQLKHHAAAQVDCPHCGSSRTVCVSQFGSTSCKALYQCKDCREPFDYFKAH